MGCNVKEKSSRPSRKKSQPPKPQPSNPNPNPNFDDSNWGYCTEDQLEEILLKKLHFIYTQALSHLISKGHDESLALRALLSNGLCTGPLDAFSNILNNSESFIRSGTISECGFSDLRQLAEHSLDEMVETLRLQRPNLTRGDAMWCLFMSRIRPQEANLIELPTEKIRVRTRLESVEPDVVESVLKSLESMSIEDEANIEELKKVEVLKKIEKIKELEVQVKERKKWAQEKAMQAAKKLSNDLGELSLLRMKKEENLRMNKGKGTVDDATMGKLTVMENALKVASMQVDRAKGVVEGLTEESKEIRAEMEAAILEESESLKKCLEVEKREKKWSKKRVACEKQREKLVEEIEEERRKAVEIEEELSGVRKAQKDVDVKWRQEKKAVEQAVTLVEEDRRAKEETEAAIKANQEALRVKIEIDFKRHKDDIKRLEDELSRLRACSPQPTKQPNDSEIHKPLKKEVNKKNGQGFTNNKLKDLPRKMNHKRECMICMSNDGNVVFLPCAHQVVCVSCSDDQEKKANACCPFCNTRIEQRIHVFGASC